MTGILALDDPMAANKETVALREHFEALLAAHERLEVERFAALDKALSKAETANGARTATWLAVAALVLSFVIAVTTFWGR